MNANRHIWEGVYKTYQEAKESSSGNGFSSDQWLKTASKKILNFREKRFRETCLSPISNRFSSLPLLVASEFNTSKSEISILDFGGGLGAHYELLKSAVFDKIKIKYHIVETRETVEAQRELFDSDENIAFYTQFPDKKINPTISYSNSALQYIDDWLGTIEKMVEEKPSYLLLDDLPAGNFETFFTLQNYYISKIPHRFFNIHSAIEEIESTGYRLVYISRYFGEILGKFSSWPMENFDNNHRLDYSCTLLFKRLKQ